MRVGKAGRHAMAAGERCRNQRQQRREEDQQDDGDQQEPSHDGNPARRKKVFFFEEKKQKTFALTPSSPGAGSLTWRGTKQTNTFCFFFQKRRPFFLTRAVCEMRPG
jgi:hypothetical protein